jgi:hypothetical protein
MMLMRYIDLTGHSEQMYVATETAVEEKLMVGEEGRRGRIVSSPASDRCGYTEPTHPPTYLPTYLPTHP